MNKELKVKFNNLMSRGKYLQATNLLKKELKTKPNNQELMFNLGFLLFSTGRLSKPSKKKEELLRQSKKLYLETISLNPTSDFGFLAKAKYEEVFGNEQKALNYYRKTYNVNPSAENTFHLANSLLYQRKNKQKEAIKYYFEALEKNKSDNDSFDDFGIFYPLVWAYQSIGDFKKSKLYAKKALKLLDKNEPEIKKIKWYKDSYLKLKEIIEK